MIDESQKEAFGNVSFNLFINVAVFLTTNKYLPLKSISLIGLICKSFSTGVDSSLIDVSFLILLYFETISLYLSLSFLFCLKRALFSSMKNSLFSFSLFCEFSSSLVNRFI